MADPLAGAPEPLGNMTTLGNDALENSESTTTRKSRRQTRADNHQDQANSLIIEPSTAGTNTPRVTTKEIWQIIEHLQHTIEKRTTLIQATRTELREVKHNQRELQTQNDKLQDEIQTRRTQIERARRTESNAIVGRRSSGHEQLRTKQEPTHRKGQELYPNQHPTVAN